MLCDGGDPVSIDNDLRQRLNGLYGIRTKILQYRHRMETFRSLLERKRSGMDMEYSETCHDNLHNVLMDLHYQIMGLCDTVTYLNTAIPSIKHQLEYLREYRSRST